MESAGIPAINMPLRSVMEGRKHVELGAGWERAGRGWHEAGRGVRG